MDYLNAILLVFLGAAFHYGFQVFGWLPRPHRIDSSAKTLLRLQRLDYGCEPYTQQLAKELEHDLKSGLDRHARWQQGTAVATFILSVGGIALAIFGPTDPWQTGFFVVLFVMGLVLAVAVFWLASKGTTQSPGRPAKS